MKQIKISIAILGAMLFGLTGTAFAENIGWYDAPWTRYEADQGTGTGTVLTSFDQNHVAYEASERTVVQLGPGEHRQWTTTAVSRGIVIRASSASSPTATSGINATAHVYINGTRATGINIGTPGNAAQGIVTLEANFGWKRLQTLSAVTPNTHCGWHNNYIGVVNNTPRMRYIEGRFLNNVDIPAGATIRIVNRGTGNMFLDFIEIEPVDPPATAPDTYVTWNPATHPNLQAWLDSGDSGPRVFIPAGHHRIGLHNGVAHIDVGQNRSIIGAGKWHTNLEWNYAGCLLPGERGAGFLSRYRSNSIRDLYMFNSFSRDRGNNAKGLNGVWNVVERLWIEYFECGIWVANFWNANNADGMLVSNSRMRSNYADGINFSRGTVNSTVTHSHFRNNGDDDMAIWPADNMATNDNTFQYITAEHTWFANAIGFYGGRGNTFRNILIRDIYEIGIRVGNAFAGTGFLAGAPNVFENIRIIRAGTWGGAYNDMNPAIRIYSYATGAGPVRNVHFRCIEIIDALSDAIHITGRTGYQGPGTFENVTLTGITVNGTGREEMLNNRNGNKGSWLHGYAIRGVDRQGNSVGGVVISDVTVTNRGGNASGNFRDQSTAWTTGTAQGNCVSVTITGVTIPNCVATLQAGATRQLSASVQGTGGTIPQTVTWTSSNTTVATVNASGLVTAIGPGSVTITATSTANNNVRATCQITVSPVTPTGVTITASRTPMAVGENFTFTASVQPTGAVQTVTWTSSNAAVASVNANTGVVRGESAGTAVITATSTANTNLRATVNVAVQNVPVTSITLANQSVAVGANVTLTPTIAPANASNRNVTWTSSNTTVATVNASGVVTGVSAGTATITATAQDGSGVTGTATITVTDCTPLPGGVDLVVESITWTPANPQPGDQVVFTATVRNQGDAPASGSMGVRFTVSSANDACDATWSEGNVNYMWRGGAEFATIAPCGTAQFTVNGGAAGNAFWPATTAGTFFVCARVDNQGQVAESNEGNNDFSTSFTVAANVPVTGINISANNQTVTVGQTVTFSATVTPTTATNPAVTYSIVGGTGSGTISGNVLTTTGAGTIQVRATSVSNSGVHSNIVTINAQPVNIPVTSVNIATVNGQTTVAAGTQVEFVTTVNPNNATNQNVTLQIFSGGTLGSLSGNILTTTGVGAIVVRATSVANPSAIADITITVEDPVGIFNPDVNEITIIAYGNTVEVKGVQIGEVISVFNVLGVKMYSRKATQSTEYISSLREGVYIVAIEGTRTVQKVIVTR